MGTTLTDKKAILLPIQFKDFYVYLITRITATVGGQIGYSLILILTAIAEFRAALCSKFVETVRRKEVFSCRKMPLSVG